jgi:hypothetical protein
MEGASDLSIATAPFLRVADARLHLAGNLVGRALVLESRLPVTWPVFCLMVPFTWSARPH